MKANVSIIKLIIAGSTRERLGSTPSQRIKFFLNQFHQLPPPQPSNKSEIHEIHTDVKNMHQLLRPNINYKYLHD